MNYGWIKLHRGIRDHWICKRDDYFSAWVKLLMEVNHSTNKTFIGGEFIECNRGESLNSIKTWARTFGSGWTESKVKTFFKHLEKDGMVVCSKIHRVTTKVSVCCYEVYQSKDSEVDKPIANQSTTDDKPIATIEEGKEENKDKKLNSIPTESGDEITPTDIIERWNKLADKEGLKKTKPSNQGVKKKISTRMESYKTSDEWNDLFKAVKEQARHLKDGGWFNLAWVVKNEENFDKVLDRWMGWKDKDFDKKDKFNDNINPEDHFEEWENEDDI